jgi:predicted PurR-regulated permease PerM
MGDSLQMHPAIVMAAVLAGGFLGGMGGMLLALPLTIALREWGVYLADRLMRPRTE